MQTLQVKKLNDREYLLSSGDILIGLFQRDEEEDQFFASFYHGIRLSAIDMHMIMCNLADINKEYQKELGG